MAATSRVQTKSQRPKSRELARNRIRDARLALSEPAHVIASRSRARYVKSENPRSIPSIKPRLVPKQNKKTQKSLIWAMRVFAVGIVGSVLIVVAIQTSIARRQIGIDTIRKEQKQEIAKFEKIRHDIAELKSPERITRRAQHLGLVQPARFISVSIPMPVASRSTQQDEELWREVKEIIDVSS